MFCCVVAALLPHCVCLMVGLVEDLCFVVVVCVCLIVYLMCVMCYLFVLAWVCVVCCYCFSMLLNLLI